jgi:glycolate oxidase subunit GlcD
LRALLGTDAVLTEPDELLVYQADALTQHHRLPRAVVFPHHTAEVSEVLRLLARERVPFAPRGAGTGLSGGALTRGVVIEMARMRRLLSLDVENRRATVETGLVNAQLSSAASAFNLHYVPDPSSQMTCTIGGNIAENAGGIHCLKYGMTVDHVAAARVVLAGGDVVDLHAGGAGAPGYDLLGVFVGSEGTFGIATEATLILTPLPPAVRTLLADFATVADGSRAVSHIIAAGLMPSALEMMDGATIRAVEQSVFAAGLPADAEAALLIELDGLKAGLDDEAARVVNICRENRARNVRLAGDERERKRFWMARKGAFGAMGRLAPDLMLQDAVVPRSRLPEVLAAIYHIGTKYNLLVANVFHAGDGNLHPYICYDARDSAELKRVKEAGREMMEMCVRAGGTITGEHGVGLDKSDDDMDAMLSLRAAFDADGLCNPGKIIPTSRSCGEARGALKLRRDTAQTREGMEKAQLSSTSSGDNRDETRETIDGNGQAPASSSETRAPVSASEPALHQRLPSPSPIDFARAPFNPEAAHEALSRITGADHVAAASRPLSPEPCLSVSPASPVEACEILRLAERKGWAVVPAGAGTWPDAGRLLPRADILLQTVRLPGRLEHEPADLVASAGAGTTLAQFNAGLKRAGQWLPLDPPDDARATLGGVAATGMIGAQGYGYGAPRSFVIGMRVALSDGRIIKAGGRVVKNVAGYDLCKLFVGSYGTLGLILELTFKLRPLPAQTATVIASGSPASLWTGARALLNAHLFPVAAELLSAQAAAAVGASLARENGCALMIRFAGASATIAFQIEQARALLKPDGETTETTVSLADEPLWQALAALPLQEQSERLIWRAHLPPRALGAILAAENSASGALWPEGCCWHAGAGDGRLRVITRLPPEAAGCIPWLEQWRSRVRSLGGWLALENAPREIKEAFDVWDDAGTSAPLMQRVKQRLDPSNTFSPGRFAADF